MALNGISTEVSGDGSDPIATKLLRRDDKLALAATKRQTAGNGFRDYNTITGTHQAYVNGTGGATLSTVSGTTSPTIARPWSLP